jgi:predicted RNase H-like nuclease (RuvC/YqgF family)
VEDIGPAREEEEAVFWGNLDRRVQKIKAYVGMPPEELAYVIRNRFQEPNASMGGAMDSVTREWKETWRNVNRSIRGGKPEEEEEGTPEEEEEKEEGCEWQSVEETEKIVKMFKTRSEWWDRTTMALTAETVDLHIQLDTLKKDTDNDIRKKKDLEGHIKANEREIRKSRKKAEKTRDRRMREEKGLKPEEEDYAMCKLVMQGKGNWVLVKAGDTYALGLAATSLWGCRRWRLPKELPRNPGEWHRKITRLEDGGPTGEEEVSFWAEYGEQAEEIWVSDKAQPEVVREMLVARLGNTQIAEWPDQVTKAWQGSRRTVEIRKERPDLDTLIEQSRYQQRDQEKRRREERRIDRDHIRCTLSRGKKKVEVRLR